MVHLYLVAVVAVLFVGNPPAEATPPCLDFPGRQGAYGSLLANDLNGIRGTVQIPLTIQGDGIDHPSAADISMELDGIFVQYGWYVGSATGLPYTTTPRWFAGQKLSFGPELLWDLGPVAPNLIGSSAQLTLLRNENSSDPPNYRHYFAFLNGVPHFEFPSASPPQMRPLAIGENAWTCTEMNARFFHLPSPYQTLELHHFNTNTWALWLEHWNRVNEPPTQVNCWWSDRWAGIGSTMWGHGWTAPC